MVGRVSERERANRQDRSERERANRQDRSERPGRVAAVAPVTLRWAVWLLYAEALAVAVVTGLLVYAALTQKAATAGTAVTVVLFMAGLAALLGLLGALLARRKGGARAPAIVLELLFVPIGYYVIEGGVPWLGAPLMLVGLVCSGLLFAPATRQSLGIH
jgi:hypothetical protein